MITWLNGSHYFWIGSVDYFKRLKANRLEFLTGWLLWSSNELLFMAFLTGIEAAFKSSYN